MLCTFTLALYVRSAQYDSVSLILCFPDMLLRYCLSDLEMVPVTAVITDITFAFTFHMC